jgi:UDP-glucose 4-epimerase
MNQKILVTGGTGYIGSHTLIDLIENQFIPISVDNGYNSDVSVLNIVEKITGQKIKHYNIDLCDVNETEKIFLENPDIVGIIHFAALKAVGESTEIPLKYYRNNLISLMNVLEFSDKYNVKAFVFSSSCTVYGEGQQSPIDENAPLVRASSPYGSTKQFSEQIILDFTKTTHFQSVLLRYFNPAGAHSSGLLGESPKNIALNLVPVITETAIGKRKNMTVYGHDYDTRDGTCIRDYIHVCDLANAHTLALQHVLNGGQKEKTDVFNLGIGEGLTVLEIINAFEKVSNMSLNYIIGERRSGDIQAIYADNSKSRKILGWNPKSNVEDIMRSAWIWEQNRSKIL